MIYCIDIDGTICDERGGRQYSYHQPRYDVISRVNKLYDEGHTIKIFTARGSSSHIDWRFLTEQQLKDWGVRYHELIFGKPSADVYVDDKAVRELP